MNYDSERSKMVGLRMGRMGRRFTLNPILFAREEQELRRQSLAQLKLSYYPLASAFLQLQKRSIKCFIAIAETKYKKP
ncbi:hypothetical protein X798_04629 [Onchocerca flexuosa]|uniref:Uncharacterized protein n=1 Tax=Onchocerca flexuosa TaxID=387005 RepID=A0A238BUQ7_9BILA|nr:hypothetical protein X798_04629 [Onchocerca flexuosa]